jgi:hypothetical protein
MTTKQQVGIIIRYLVDDQLLVEAYKVAEFSYLLTNSKLTLKSTKVNTEFVFFHHRMKLIFCVFRTTSLWF